MQDEVLPPQIESEGGDMFSIDLSTIGLNLGDTRFVFRQKEQDLAEVWPLNKSSGPYVLKQALQCGDFAEKLKGARVLDVASGNGIMGIILAKLGASNVVMVDNNPAATELSLVNAGLNNVGEKCRAITTDNIIYDGMGKFDLVVGNLPFSPSLEYGVDTLSKAMRSNESGILGRAVTEKLLENLPGFTHANSLICFSASSRQDFIEISKLLNTKFPNAWKVINGGGKGVLQQLSPDYIGPYKAYLELLSAKDWHPRIFSLDQYNNPIVKLLNTSYTQECVEELITNPQNGEILKRITMPDGEVQIFSKSRQSKVTSELKTVDQELYKIEIANQGIFHRYYVIAIDKTKLKES